MRPNKLVELGVPRELVSNALQLVQAIAKYNRTVEKDERLNINDSIRAVCDNPTELVSESIPYNQQRPEAYNILKSGDAFASALIEERAYVRPDPVPYTTFGAEGIDEGSHEQMRQACSLPNAHSGALMPDAHLGYGLPIGGVLALKGAVCPFAVGVDIACRMKLSILDTHPDTIKTRREHYKVSLEQGTAFGMGARHDKPQDHDIMDDSRWYDLGITRNKRDKAHEQLGSSGSGNHFVEYGIVTLEKDNGLGLEPGKYVALMSHSGSRNPGHSVCGEYSKIAQSRLPNRFKDLGRLAWLDMDSEAGQEYWLAMNLMGDYASANHDVIHRLVTKKFGANIIGGIENHHNFAWKEVHDGEEVYVHRKGATPAGKGVLGVIPGSMEHPAYLVRGKGNADSLNSASHGAGRAMSRKKGKEKYSKGAVQGNLLKKGISVLGMGADESPGCYKNIDEVMARQKDLVEVIGKFLPKIVKMDGSGSKAED
jgi:tRNA-splicing ligase RtcB